MVKEKTLVPELRFNSFQDTWSSVKLESFFKIFNGYAFSSSDAAKEGVRWLKIADVGVDTIENDNLSFLPTSLAEKHSKFLLKKGDYVVALTRPIIRNRLKIAKVDESADGSLLNQRVGKIVSENNLSFVYSVLQRYAVISRIEAQIAGTDPPNLSPNEINNLKTAIPSLPEQEKIAAFLTSVDDRIDQLKRKKSLLQDYKKGVMQRLFSQQLRFKDNNGNNYPDWEEKKLGEVIKVNPKSPSLPDSFLYIDLESVNDGILSTPSRISKSDAPSRAQRLMQKGDVLYQMVRPYQKNNLKFSLDGTYVASTGFAQLRATTNSSDFIYQLLLTERFTDIVLKRCTGTSYPAINSSDLADIEIQIASPNEQTKIANYLSNIDTKLEQVTQQITQTQTFKRGLLQQMFV